MPDVGPLLGLTATGLQDVRGWPVRKFRKHLIIYRSIPDGIEVLRVLHEARNIEALLQQG